MSKRSGSSRRWQWAWPLVLALFFFFCIAQQARPQESSVTELRQRIESLRLHLQTIIASAQRLENESETWRQLSIESARRANELLSELAELRQELETWQSESGELARQLDELKELQAKSEAKLRLALETSRRSSDSWRAALDQADRDLRSAKAARWLWAVIAGLAGLGIGLGLSQLCP